MNEPDNQEMMVVQTAAMPLAVALMDANVDSLSQEIEKSFAAVYVAVESGKIQQHGQNVIVYRQLGGKVEIECGVQVPGPFPGPFEEIGKDMGKVVFREMPAVRAATTTHRGEYARLGESHMALMTWSHSHGLRPTGLRWEVYGDWNENPDELRVEIFHQVAEDPGY